MGSISCLRINTITFPNRTITGRRRSVMPFRRCLFISSKRASIKISGILTVRCGDNPMVSDEASTTIKVIACILTVSISKPSHMRQFHWISRFTPYNRMRWIEWFSQNRIPSTRITNSVTAVHFPPFIL